MSSDRGPAALCHASRSRQALTAVHTRAATTAACPRANSPAHTHAHTHTHRDGAHYSMTETCAHYSVAAHRSDECAATQLVAIASHGTSHRGLETCRAASHERLHVRCMLQLPVCSCAPGRTACVLRLRPPHDELCPRARGSLPREPLSASADRSTHSRGNHGRVPTRDLSGTHTRTHTHTHTGTAPATAWQRLAPTTAWPPTALMSALTRSWWPLHRMAHHIGAWRRAVRYAMSAFT